MIGIGIGDRNRGLEQGIGTGDRERNRLPVCLEIEFCLVVALCLWIMLCLVIGLRLGTWICYNLNCSLLKHIVSLTIISGSPFKHGKHRVS